MDGLVLAEPALRRALTFNVANDPAIEEWAAEFTGPRGEPAVRFLNTVLPDCGRMIEFGAHAGFTTLHAAARGVEVFAFEPNPAAHDLLVRNAAANPGLMNALHLFQYGVGSRDEQAALYVTGPADPGASILQYVERLALIRGTQTATVRLREASAVLREIGIDRRTLLKIDIQGAEYEVVPTIAAQLAEAKPWLYLTFQPQNLTLGDDPYRTEVLRIQAAMEVAEALSHYHYLHVWSNHAWESFAGPARTDFLRQNLMRAKPLPRIRTPQYGFTGSVAFSDQPLREPF